MSKPGMGYALAVVATVLAALVRWALDPLLANTGQFLVFYFSVMLVAVAAAK